MLRLMRLQIADALSGLAPRPADHLIQQLERTLRGTRIAIAQTKIGIDDPDQIQAREMMSLGDELRADDDIDAAFGNFIQLAAHRLDRENPSAYVEQELTAARTDWRPLVSYTSNLARVGEEMLGTPAAWDKLAQLRPGAERDMARLRNVGSQYPWTWSAGVLVALFGLSVWILNRSIKSLDRLK